MFDFALQDHRKAACCLLQQAAGERSVHRRSDFNQETLPKPCAIPLVQNRCPSGLIGQRNTVRNMRSGIGLGIDNAQQDFVFLL